MRIIWMEMWAKFFLEKRKAEWEKPVDKAGGGHADWQKNVFVVCINLYQFNFLITKKLF